MRNRGNQFMLVYVCLECGMCLIVLFRFINAWINFHLTSVGSSTTCGDVLYVCVGWDEVEMSGWICSDRGGGRVGWPEQQVGGHCLTSKGSPIPPEPFWLYVLFYDARADRQLQVLFSVYVSCSCSLGKYGWMDGWMEGWMGVGQRRRGGKKNFPH